MLSLAPITVDNIPDLEDTSYAEMSDEEKRRMVRESRCRRHDGAYFELFSVSDDGQIVGFMNLYARSDRTISIGPEIKKRLQGRGYGFAAETLALDHARQMGCSSAVAEVREDNAASIALHEKLGFSCVDRRINQHGNPVRVYIKALSE